MDNVIILLIVLLVIFFLTQTHIFEGMANNDDIVYFNNRLAAATYASVVYEFGPPTSKLDKPDGMVIWKYPAFFDEIVLRDEAIEHTKPEPHCDFLYLSIQVFVPDHLLPNIGKISDSLYYDKSKKTLTARCNNMQTNVALLFLAMKLVNNPELTDTIVPNADKAIKKSVYGSSVYEGMKNELEAMVRHNQEVFVSVMPNKKCYIPTHNMPSQTYNKLESIGK